MLHRGLMWTAVEYAGVQLGAVPNWGVGAKTEATLFDNEE
jgi:hypothetical protein